MARVHSFGNDLEWALSPFYDAFCHEAYATMFPGQIVSWKPSPAGLAGQRLGIDRQLRFRDRRRVFVEEKVRKPDCKFTSDVLLEYLSNDVTGAPGWIERDLACDLFLYGWAYSGECILWEWPVLKNAWDTHCENWRLNYRPLEARNDGYSTWSIAVPRPELARTAPAHRTARINLEVLPMGGQGVSR